MARCDGDGSLTVYGYRQWIGGNNLALKSVRHVMKLSID